MAKGSCLVAAALAACSWQQGRAGWALAAADPAAARTRRWPWLNRLRRKSDEGEAAAAPDESPRTRRALTACDAGSFWSLATATCEVCGSGEFSASGAAACTRCGDFSYELEDNAWPAESRTVVVGACNCQGAFPYQHHSMPQICYTHASYATAGSGPCGSWCTLDAAVGSGCGDNSGRMCTGSCNLGAVATPMNYELSFTIDIDATEPFSGWTNILAITSAETGWDVERYPSIFFGDGGYLHLAQTYRKPTSTGDWGANCYLDSATWLVAGNTYGIKVTHVDNLLSMYIYDQDEVLRGHVHTRERQHAPLHRAARQVPSRRFRGDKWCFDLWSHRSQLLPRRLRHLGPAELRARPGRV